MDRQEGEDKEIEKQRGWEVKLCRRGPSTLLALSLKHTHTHTKVTIIHHIIKALATLFLPACCLQYILFSP